MRLRWYVALLAPLVSGCMMTPEFERISGVTPKTIIDVIECEIIAAKRKDVARVARLERLRQQGKLPREYVIRRLNSFQAVAELTLQVDERATLTPSFAHTDVVSKSLTRAFDWGVKFDSQSQRVYSETVAFNVGAMSDARDSCSKLKAGISLNGKLGIEEVVDMAFGSIDPDDKAIDYPSSSAEIDDVGSRRRGGGTKAAFGTSLEFSVVKGIGPAGPTWNLVHFRGPGKMFAAERSDTHRLTISFALTKDGALMQNLMINNGSLPTTISKKLQFQLQ